MTFDLDDTLWDTWSVLTQAHATKQQHLERYHPVSGRFPFKTGCLPLDCHCNPGGNPGGNGESYRGVNWKRLGQRIAARWDLEACREFNIATRKARPDLAHSFTAAHREAIRLQVVAVGGYADEAAAVDDIFGAFQAARNSVTLYPGALEALRCEGVSLQTEKCHFKIEKCQFLACVTPLDTVCLPLNYSGNPGVKRRISQGWKCP